MQQSPYELQREPCVSLLAALREYLGLSGPPKACHHGACGACTVLIDGERINACLLLAVQHEGREITTVEGWRMAHCSRCEPRVSPTAVFDGFPVCHSLF